MLRDEIHRLEKIASKGTPRRALENEPNKKAIVDRFHGLMRLRRLSRSALILLSITNFLIHHIQLGITDLLAYPPSRNCKSSVEISPRGL